MKRFALLLAVSSLVTGCADEPTPEPRASTVTPAKPSAPQVKPPPADTNPAAVAERKLKGYFELKQDGTTYVAEDLATLKKIKTDGKASAASPEWTDVNGKKVVFQDDGAGLVEALKKEYVKSHPKIEAH